MNQYLSEVKRGELDNALKRWQLSDMGPMFATLDAEQEQEWVEGRRELAVELTEGLGIAKERLMWKTQRISYYGLQKSIPVIEDDDTNADLASIEIMLIVVSMGGDNLEESLAFNLWKSTDKGWRITGLDRGMSMLEPFFDDLRDFH